MQFAFYLGDSGRIGLNLHFKSDVKSGLRLTCQSKHNFFLRSLASIECDYFTFLHGVAKQNISFMMSLCAFLA